jgi:hypothetical protein
MSGSKISLTRVGRRLTGLARQVDACYPFVRRSLSRLRLQTVLVVGLPALASIGATGCGGDDQGRLSRAEFALQANAICADYTARLAAIPPGETGLVGGGTTLQTKVLPLFRKQLAEIRALRPPADDERTFTNLTETWEQLLAIGSRSANAAIAGDLPTVERLGTQIARLDGRVNSLLQDLGATTCAEQ